jgi:hypothetical protein
MTVSQDMVRDLVLAFPQLRQMYDEHVADNDEVLPHVIFGIGDGITDRVIAAYVARDPEGLDWRGILDHLDEQLGLDNKEITDVICTDFLYGLPWSGQPGHTITEELPPRLRSMYGWIQTPKVTPAARALS